MCLDSILNQTYQNIELVCVNDGSPDNCGQILEKYAAMDERILNRRTNVALETSGYKETLSEQWESLYQIMENYVHENQLPSIYEEALENGIVPSEYWECSLSFKN